MKTQSPLPRYNRETADLANILNDCSIDAIIAIDTQHNIIAWNNAAALIYKKNKIEVLGKSLMEAIPSMAADPETLRAIDIAKNGIKSFLPASRSFDHRRHVENHFIPLKDDEGNPQGIMNLVHDVSHRIKAEENLQHLNEELERRLRQLRIASEELAYFTYITSNKIKEPIRQVYTSIEHLIKIEADKLTDSGKASFRRIQSSVNRMDLLLDDMLKLSQISIMESPDKYIDVNILVHEVAEALKKKAQKRVNIMIEPLCSIKGHEEYLRSLFHQLIDNAIKFNEHEEAEIRISSKEMTVDQISYCRYSVADNGIGFAPEEATKIFSMFEKLHQGKYKGSGVGLTIAKKIMEVHDGFIEAESAPGKGSAFHCYFRLEQVVEPISSPVYSAA